MLNNAPIYQALVLVLLYLGLVLWSFRHRFIKTTLQPGETLVAYASEGGSSAQLAKDLASHLKVQAVSLNQLKPQQLLTIKQLYLISSTYGDGEAPSNGRLWEKRWRVFSQAELDLSHLSFAVLGLGDSSYPHYCAFAERLFNALDNALAQPLFDLIKVDNLAPAALEQWQQQLQNQLKEQGINSPLNAASCVQPNAEHQVHLLKRTLLNAGSEGAPIYQLDFDSHCIPPWQAGDIALLQLNGQQREYSIASLPSENTLRLLVREKYHPSGEIGLGSGFLCRQLQEGESCTFILRKNPAFYAPDANQPMILIGNGTGLAGLRAHIKQRPQGSQNWLIYGERSPIHDRIWNQELNDWCVSGQLSQLDLAFSRHQGCNFPGGTFGRCNQGYVQQVIRDHASELQQWLNQNATFYLCGSKQGMAQDVEQALMDILGEAVYIELVEQERIKLDVY
ncbi:MAG: NADPH cytochrome P450 oxidoreductase family protein [Venatoribacter sp.]